MATLAAFTALFWWGRCRVKRLASQETLQDEFHKLKMDGPDAPQTAELSEESDLFKPELRGAISPQEAFAGPVGYESGGSDMRHGL